jgi:hypothetical protein
MKKIVRFLALLVLISAGVVLYRYPTWLPDLEYLRIREVVVNVEAPLTELEVRRTLPLLVGKNLLLVSGVSLMEKMRQNPWVLSATVKKEYPDRIVLSAQSKKPVATRQEAHRLVFIDENGAEIDRWTPGRAADFDLPVIAFDKPETAKLWNSRTLVGILNTLHKAAAPKYRVSQLVPTDPPYFKVFLTSPPLEILFSQHTYETQLPFFIDVLSRPPRQIGQASKINLVFPKKAVVSFPVPH